MATKIFLAHGREDKPQVRNLYRDLKARGFDPWLDEEDLDPGQVWPVEIPKAIRQAGVFLACLSSQSVGRIGYVHNEFRLALSALGSRPSGTTFLIPVRLDECDVPDLQVPDLGLSLRDIHWVNLWQEGGFERLVRALERALKKPNEALPQPDHTVQLPLGVIPDGAPDINTPDDARIEELLRQPISEKTLSYYTRWKYPGRSIDHAAQRRLLEDLVYSHFKTMQDLDSAIDAAVDAVDHYRKENPNTFQTGTDFLVVSLAFVNTGFRARHRFSSQSRRDFPKYEHLIKSAGTRRPVYDQETAVNSWVPSGRDDEPPSLQGGSVTVLQGRIVTPLVVGGLSGVSLWLLHGFDLLAVLLFSSGWVVAGAVSEGRRHDLSVIGLASSLLLIIMTTENLLEENSGLWIFGFGGVVTVLGLMLLQSRPIPRHDTIVAGTVAGLLGGVVGTAVLWYYYSDVYAWYMPEEPYRGPWNGVRYWASAWVLGFVAAIAGAISCARWLGIIGTGIGAAGGVIWVGIETNWGGRSYYWLYNAVEDILPLLSIGLIGGALLSLLLVVIAERNGVTLPIVRQSNVSALLRVGLARLRYKP